MNTDIDECEVIDDLCGDDTCQNTDGSFTCQCADGYILLLPTLDCVDDDECTDPTSCDDTAICTNTDGSYSCSCAEGFKMHTDDTCRGTSVLYCIVLYCIVLYCIVLFVYHHITLIGITNSKGKWPKNMK